MRQEALIRVADYATDVPMAALANRVGSYLSDQTTVLPQLQVLEAEMNADMTAFGYVDVAAARAEFKNRINAKLNLALQNLLSTVLARHETASGFKMGARNRTWSPNQPTSLLITGVLQPDDFRAVIADRMPFKDPTVPGGHGEFTHRIQFYCLIRSALALPAGKTWADFYAWVGQRKHRAGADYPDLGLWDALFDRNKEGSDGLNGPYNTVTLEDFRSPENMHEQMTRDLKVQLPLLSALLKAREAKREASGIRTDEAELRHYLARKLYGAAQTYDTVSLASQGRIRDTLARGSWLPSLSPRKPLP